MENVVQFPGLGLEFSFRYYFEIGPFRITYYGIIIAIGMLLAMVYAYRNFRKIGVDPDRATDAVLGGIIGGLIGARLYYVMFSAEDYSLSFAGWEEFWQSAFRLINTTAGGMAIYGGIIGALIVGLLIAKWRRIHIPALLDIVGIGFLLGQGIGRWGNFFNVEAFGSNTTLPWGMTGPNVVSYLTAHSADLEAVGVTVDPNLPVHPTFLYESLWCLLGFVLLAFYLKHRKFDGEVFLMYLGYYGFERFLVEGLRTDSLMIGTLRVSQLLAALLVLTSIILLLVIRSKIKNSHDEEYLKLYVKTEIGQRILNKQDYEELMPPKKKKSKSGQENTEISESRIAQESVNESSTTEESDGVPAAENDSIATIDTDTDQTDSIVSDGDVVGDLQEEQDNSDSEVQGDSDSDEK